MAMKLFNPFARYVVLETDPVYYPDEYGYHKSVDRVAPVHYTDNLEDAEKVAHVLGKAKEGHTYYEVCENAAWKALDKRRTTLKATGYGEPGELPGIDTQLGIAAEVLHDMLEPPAYPEETSCDVCGCGTGSFTRAICGGCEQAKAWEQRKKEREARFGQKSQNLSKSALQPSTHRALERTDAPDTPTAKPEGHGVWTK